MILKIKSLVSLKKKILLKIIGNFSLNMMKPWNDRGS